MRVKLKCLKAWKLISLVSIGDAVFALAFIKERTYKTGAGMLISAVYEGWTSVRQGRLLKRAHLMKEPAGFNLPAQTKINQMSFATTI